MLARPGQAAPRRWSSGPAAVALLVGATARISHGRRPLATILSAAHLAADFVDHYRLSGEDFDYALEERWVRDEGLSKQLPGTIARTLAAAE